MECIIMMIKLTKKKFKMPSIQQYYGQIITCHHNSPLDYYIQLNAGELILNIISQFVHRLH